MGDGTPNQRHPQTLGAKYKAIEGMGGVITIRCLYVYLEFQ